MPKKAEISRLNKLAQQGIARGASGMYFEGLHKQGWRPPSQVQGDGLGSCGPECGICNPPVVLRKRKK